MPFGNQPVGSSGVAAGAVQPGPVVVAANPSAVQQLSDAYHNRLITAQEIGERMKTSASRTGAQNAINRNAQAQAEAQARLTPTQEDLARKALERERAALQYGDVVKEVPPTLKHDGTIDWAKTSQRGYQLRLAGMGLQGGTPQVLVHKDGSQEVVVRNSFGENITPGQPAWKHYQKLRQEALLGFLPDEEESGGATAPSSTPPSAATPAPTGVGAPVVQANGYQDPGDITPNQMRAQLGQLPPAYAGQGKYSSTDWTNVPDADVVRAWHALGQTPAGRAQVQPAAAPSAPVAPAVAPIGVTPSAPAPVVQPQASALGTLGPSGGIITQESPSFGNPAAIVDELHKQKSYEAFDQQKGYANSFLTTAGQVAAMTPQQQSKTPMNQHDISLAENLIKMYDPQGTIREFKWDKFAENQPLLERLKNVQSEFLRTGTFTPQTRSRLIDMGLSTVNAKEDAAAPQVNIAAQRLKAAGIDPSTQLDSDELRIANGQRRGVSGPGYVPDTSPQSAAPAAQSPTIKTLPSGLQVIQGADGQWYPAGASQPQSSTDNSSSAPVVAASPSAPSDEDDNS